MPLRTNLLGICLLLTTAAAVFAAPAAVLATSASRQPPTSPACARSGRRCLAQLANLKIQYRTADAQQQAAIQAQWGPLMDQATELKDKVLAAAQKAYAAAPNADPQVTDLLVTLLQQVAIATITSPRLPSASSSWITVARSRTVPNLAGTAAFR